MFSHLLVNCVGICPFKTKHGTVEWRMWSDWYIGMWWYIVVMWSDIPVKSQWITTLLCNSFPPFLPPSLPPMFLPCSWGREREGGRGGKELEHHVYSCFFPFSFYRSVYNIIWVIFAIFKWAILKQEFAHTCIYIYIAWNGDIMDILVEL